MLSGAGCRRPVALFFAVIVALVAAVAAGASGGDRVIADKLSDPRGIAVGPNGELLVVETGGGDPSAPGAITTLSRTGKGHQRGGKDDHGAGKDDHEQLSRDPKDESAPDPKGESVPVPGAVDVVVGRLGQTFVVTGGGAPPSEGGEAPAAAQTTEAEPTEAHPASILRLLPNGGTALVADIGAYQKTDPDPDDRDQPANPTESNPNGAALLRDGSLLVVDAAGNDLLRVSPKGEIKTVARFKPEAVTVPADIPDGPKAGTVIPAESVPTAVSVGPDGAYYVSELKGFPFAPETSRVWRIAPGVTGAVCDPTSTATVESGAACASFQGGFTSIIDLAWGRNDALYVLEIARQGVGVLESGGDPTGALFEVRDGHASELVPGALVAPGGIAIDKRNRLSVTTGTILGPEAGSVVSVQG